MLRRFTTPVAVIGISVVLLFSTFRSISVCGRCGCKVSATDFQLPIVPLTYWRHQTIEQTPLSTVARDLGFLEPHSHDWKLIHGGGNGILCAVGNGGEIDPAVRSWEVAQFLADTSRYRGRDESEAWFQMALDDRSSRALYDWIRLTDFPSDGYATANGYDHWRKRADSEWPDFVQQNSP